MRSSVPQPILLTLTAGIGLASVPHLGHLPLWVAALAAAILAWRAWAGWRDERLPRRPLVIALTLIAVAGVYITHRTLLGRDAGVTLLVVLLALKMMEMRGPRDVVVAAVLCYFLALTSFFYSQTVFTAALTALTIFLLTTALAGVNAAHRPLRKHLQTAGMLLVQGVPLMVILFLLFPRVQGPLWGMPEDAFSGRTGLSDSMTPGNISMLSQSDAIAFRAQFRGEAPERRALYWRGPVFWRFDGRTWTAGDVRVAERYEIQAIGDPVDYTVTLEPHNRSWLFALEMAARLPENATATGDYQLLARAPVRTRMRYDASSYPRFRAIGGASPQELEAALQLPKGFNPRTLALARAWRDSTTSDVELLAKAIDHFKRGNYVYTLMPPLAGEHSVDEFLFDSRRGFCEHFSSAFAMLMRAAGVPTRIVTGYQGGEINPVDNYLIVRQADAHAWAEVWLQGQGWLRVDPTAAAVPERVEAGLAAAMPIGEPLPFVARADLSWLRTLRFNLDALTNSWNQWVLGYDPDRQRQLLSRLGMPSPNWQEIALALFWTLGLLVLLLSLWLLRRITHADPAQLAWIAFCAKLKRKGIARRANEGPIAYASRAATALPRRAVEVVAIAQLYVDQRYGPAPDRERLAQLTRLVRRFRP